MVRAAVRAAALWCGALLATVPPDGCSPSALAASPDGRTLYVACAAARRVEVFDTGRREVAGAFAVPSTPTGLALWPDGSRLYVTCAAPASTVQVIPLPSGAPTRSIPAGHTAEAPVLSPDLRTLYVSNRFSNDLTAIDTVALRPAGRASAAREPAGAVPSRDGRLLFVANTLPAGRADAEYVGAEITLLDTQTRRPTGRITLPNGSTGLHGIAASPDGSVAAVTHLLARYYLPTTQLERGWVQTNALSLLDLPARKLLATVLLDDVDRGAANPWAVAWSPDGRWLAVSHAGTHEVSLLDAPGLLNKVRRPRREPAEDLSFLTGLRRRIPLSGRGPRALAWAGPRLWVAGYFSETIEAIDAWSPAPAAAMVYRWSAAPPTAVRRGEALFNDATICFQDWQSCASCHSPDARVDSLNWDLLNDGIGNPKNVKSLLLAHRTPPTTSHGVRGNAEISVRAGLRHILFAERPEEEAAAIDEFLKSLQPIPSPFLAGGKLSPAAERGGRLFFDARTGCASCHPAGLYTDLQSYDVGTVAPTDSGARFDTPTLVEVWRTAPYLHNGSAATLLEVLTTANREDRHGRTSHLTRRQVHDLIAFLLSL
jgi:cytochrome c peroxidase/DNA-binding beta-propeller fold protein YncE